MKILRLLLITIGLIVGMQSLNAMSDFVEAVRKNDLSWLKELFEEQKGKLVPDSDGWTLLHYAMFIKVKGLANECPVVDFLLEKGFDINAQTKTGQTPLHIAVREKNFPIFIVAINTKGIKLDLKDSRGWAPVHHAAFNNHNSMMSQFTEAAEKDLIDPEDTTNDGETALGLWKEARQKLEKSKKGPPRLKVRRRKARKK